MNSITPSVEPGFDQETVSRLRQDYQKDGYVLLKGFLSPEEVSETLEQLALFRREVLPTMPDHHVFYEDKDKPDTLKQLQHLDEYHPFFHDLLHGSRFQRVAEILLEDAVVPRNFQYFNKPPLVGQPTPPHQDGYYFMLNPCEAVTMWLALESVDEINGCVRYIPGSHQREMRPHTRTGTLGFSQGILNYGPDDFAQERSFPAEAGDLLVHHAMTIHRADRNNSSTRTRQALGFIYYAERAREDKAAHEAYAEKLRQEMQAGNRI